MSEAHTVRTLSISESIRQAGSSYLDVLSRPGHFIAASAIWIAVAFALSLAVAESSGPLPISGQPRSDQIAINLIDLLAQMALLIAYCLAWQRIVIRRATPLGATYVQALPRYALYDIAAVMALVVILVVLTLPVIFLVKSRAELAVYLAYVPLLSYVVSLFLFARFTLAFGAAAAGNHEMSLRASWRKLRGSVFAVVIGMLLLIAPATALTMAADYIAAAQADSGPPLARHAIDLLAGFLGFLGTAVGCTYASRIYLKAIGIEPVAA